MSFRHFFVVLGAGLLLLAAGCGRGDGSVTPDEQSDPLYQQAHSLKNQGRNGEALATFERVIARRGEAGSPLSHFEAGNLYLNFTKDPFEAYHHFSKFLQLEPRGTRSDVGRGQREAAMREAAKWLNAPQANQTVQLQASEDIERLRRRVQELEAELQTLRGGSVVPLSRAAPVIAMSDDGSAGSGEPTMTPVPYPSAPPESSFTRALTAARPSVPAASTPPPTARPASTTASSGADRSVAPPTRPGDTGRRAHTVGAADKSLWAIGRRYYGPRVTAAQVQAIYEANRDIMRSNTDLRAGMVLRIP